MWVVRVIYDGCFGQNMGASSQIEKEREVAASRARERERDGRMDGCFRVAWSVFNSNSGDISGFKI
jgi:hypothetical protein